MRQSGAFQVFGRILNSFKLIRRSFATKSDQHQRRIARLQSQFISDTQELQATDMYALFEGVPIREITARLERLVRYEVEERGQQESFKRSRH